MTLQQLLSDPCLFFKECTGFTPTDYQKWLLCANLLDGKKYAALLARRAGKTKVVGAKLAHEAVNTLKRDFVVLLLAPSTDQTALVYDEIRKCLGHPLLAALCRKYEDKTGRRLANNQKCCEIPNRAGGLSTIRLLAGDARGGSIGTAASYSVGFGADVLVIEEAGICQTSTINKILWSKATGPYRSVIAIGTPRHCSGYFHDVCIGPEADNRWPQNTEYSSALGFQVCHRDLYHTHVAQDRKILAEIEASRRTMSLSEWLSEGMAQFNNAGGNFFDPYDIERSLAPVPKWFDVVRDNRRIIASIDLAGIHDYSVLSYFASNPSRNQLTLLYSEFFQKTPEEPWVRKAENLGQIVERMNLLRKEGLNPIKVYADISNQSSFEDLLRQASFNVEGITWSAKTKTHLMFLLKDSLSSGKIVLPNDSRSDVFVQQLLAYSFRVSDHGNYIFNIDESLAGRRKKDFDDGVSSLAMGCLFLSTGAVAPVSRVVKPKQRKEVKWDYSIDYSREMQSLNL